jgi:hypothetical protein
MAGFAFGTGMAAIQWESGTRMIETRRALLGHGKRSRSELEYGAKHSQKRDVPSRSAHNSPVC